MPSNFFGTRSPLITSVGQTLRVSGGNFTLVNRGQSVLPIIAGGNAVAGVTITSSDPSKVSVVSGYTIKSTADSGSAVLTLTHPNYGTGTVTITCSALNFILDAALGTNTTANGAAVTSWADQEAGAAFVGAVNTPVYATNSQNGLPGVTFDGTASLLATASAVTALNVATISLFIVCKPTAGGDGRATSRTVLSNATSTAGGFIIRFISTNKIEILVEGGSQNSIQTTSTYTGGAARYLTLLMQNGTQLLRVGGTQEASTAFAYAASSAIAELGDSIGGTTYFPGDIELILSSSRIWTPAEQLQLELMARNVYGL